MEPKQNNIYEIMIVGVGGQGIVKLGQFFQQYAMDNPKIFNMVAIESRGVSQREGSVYAIIRYAIIKPENRENVGLSPLPTLQQVDLMLALEPLEFLRNLHYISPKGIVILNSQVIIPKSAINQGKSTYPDIPSILTKFTKIYPDIKLIVQNFTESKSASGFASLFSNVKMLDLLPDAYPELFNTPEFRELQKKFFKE